MHTHHILPYNFFHVVNSNVLKDLTKLIYFHVNNVDMTKALILMSDKIRFDEKAMKRLDKAVGKYSQMVRQRLI